MSDTGLYNRVAQEISSIVIARYSTSFSLASRLLDPASRQHIENIYALVRVADEIADGAATAAGIDPVGAARLLTALEHDTEHAMEHGFSANPVVHAFALTAREADFGTELTAPFFESMRTDLSEKHHDAESFERYVYGSAEVVGLMCLRAFLVGSETTPEHEERLEHGARRLGAAFQKVNFLRDLAADYRTLGRSYFPGVEVESFSDEQKNAIVDDILADLREAAPTIPQLPKGSRRAVALAHGLFANLATRLRATPAQQLLTSRVRVPSPVKLRIAAGAAVGRTPRG